MRKATILLWMSLSASLFGAQALFDASQNVWVLNNGLIQATFQLTPEGYFVTQSIVSLENGDQWTSPRNRTSSLIHLQAGADVFDVHRQFTLVDQYSQTIKQSGVRQYIVLLDANAAAQITVILDIYDNQPVLRYTSRYRNLTSTRQYVTGVDMLPWTFADSNQRYTAFRVNQWSLSSRPEDFEQTQGVLDLNGTAVEVYSGAHAQQCGWLAVRDGSGRGLFAGWEFDGRSKSTLQQQGSQNFLQFNSTILNLNHPVEPAADFQIPWAFLGLFHGDFDEAGYRTQKFAEAVLAQPPPPSGAFPYVAWDSWAYGDQIDEAILKQNAEIAASLGVELFIVDLGWARGIGDWYEDLAKFPHGLSDVSNYVHSLGMKFGLHFALAEANDSSPVLQEHPDWTSTDSSSYFGANSLCLSNQPTRDWVVQQGIRIIDDYDVDWILQDGENMVKQCTKTTHTHDASDSNYANAVEGINAVVSAIQKARPNVYWENCENGGNMMTFSMVKRYVTSITNDGSGSLSSRKAAYGATYPFSPRYADRYMPASDGLTPYAIHSYRFGGNWAIMNQLPKLSPDDSLFLAQQIRNYKTFRAGISTGKVYHILAPTGSGIDAIQSYDAVQDQSTAVITRGAGGAPDYVFHPQGLDPGQQYTVWFEISPSVYSVPGAQLMSTGIRVKLPTPYSSDIVHIDHQ